MLTPHFMSRRNIIKWPLDSAKSFPRDHQVIARHQQIGLMAGCRGAIEVNSIGPTSHQAKAVGRGLWSA